MAAVVVDDREADELSAIGGKYDSEVSSGRFGSWEFASSEDSERRRGKLRDDDDFFCFLFGTGCKGQSFPSA